jgi:hypothetical protein
MLKEMTVFDSELLQVGQLVKVKQVARSFEDIYFIHKVSPCELEIINWQGNKTIIKIKDVTDGYDWYEENPSDNSKKLTNHKTTIKIIDKTKLISI